MHKYNAQKTTMPRPLQTEGTKVCTTCGVKKDIQEFYFRGGKASPNSRKSKCKECDKEQVRQRYAQDPSKSKNNHLQRKYGITLDDYNRMLEEQNHQCATCGTTEPGGKHNIFAVDHCHTTGKVRGLLCKNCNIALGLLGDDVELMDKMINYLEG